MSRPRMGSNGRAFASKCRHRLLSVARDRRRPPIERTCLFARCQRRNSVTTEKCDRFERVTTSNIAVPANGSFVTLEFDACYDLEDEPTYDFLAYDGATLRIADVTGGHAQRPNLVEAFAEWIKTGSAFHFPKHLPRNNNPAFFQDMSVWSGDSQGFKHVSMRLPGMQGTSVQLWFEFTQDSALTCADMRPGHACGMMVDNVVMKSWACTSLTGVTIAAMGSTALCPTGATGGTATVTDANGGGTSHQWGRRAISGGMVTAIPGETGLSYVLDPADFPGVGTYFLVCTTTPQCGAITISNEITVTIANDAQAPAVTAPTTATVTQSLCQ